MTQLSDAPVRLYLRHDRTEVPLQAGESLIGREPTCSLHFDDPLLSRHHARLTVDGDRATIEDLESVNGVLVNGQRVVVKRALEPGDKIFLGNQELELVRAGGERGPSSSSDLHRITVEALRKSPSSISALGARPDAAPDTTERVDTFGLICKVVDRVLAEGRGGDAERMLAPQLEVLLREAERRGDLPEAAAVRAAEYGTRLASSTGNARWIDYVVKLYAALSRPLPATSIAALADAAIRAPAFDRNAVRAYLSTLRSSAERLSPGERVALEGLEPLARSVAR